MSGRPRTRRVRGRLSVNDAFAFVDEVYSTAANCVITAEAVEHAGTQEFVRRLRALERGIDDAQNEIWSAFRRTARRAAWDILNAPLPLAHPLMGLQNANEELE